MEKIRICALSDTHGFLPEILHDNIDMVLIAGDIGPATVWYHSGNAYKWFNDILQPWLNRLRDKDIGVFAIAGNHDIIQEKYDNTFRELNWTYLQDESYVYHIGNKSIKIYGTPWTPNYGYWAFMESEEALENKWNKIPEDTNILITHGPPLEMGDRNQEGINCGSRTLKERLKKLNDIKLHVFGHIHEGQGYFNGIQANVSYVDRSYVPNMTPPIFEIEV